MDTAEFDALRRDDRFVRGLARRLLSEDAAAEDVAQETWLEALRRKPEGGPRFRGWLAKVTRHIASNARREGSRRTIRELAAARQEGVPPETALIEREEVRRRLVEAVVALGKPRSTFLVLRYFEGLPPRAIARQLGMPVETVRTHLKRGLAQLREALAREKGPGGIAFLQSLVLLLPGPALVAGAFGVAFMTANVKIITVVVAGLALASWFVWTRDGGGDRPDERRVPAARVAHEDAGMPQPVKPPGPPPIATQPFSESGPEAEPAKTAQPARCVMRGLVVDATGTPLPGAGIRGGPQREERLDAANLAQLTVTKQGSGFRTGDGVRLSPNGVFVTQSGDDGRFEVAALPACEAFDVAAFSEKHGIIVVSGVPLRPDTLSEVTLRFEPAVVLRGRVTDEDGRPITKSNVSIMGSRDGSNYSSFLTVPCEDDGTWRTIPLPHRKFGLGAEAPGFKSDHVWAIEAASARNGEIIIESRLDRAGVIGGRLIRTDGSSARLDEVLRTRRPVSNPEECVLIASSNRPDTPRFRDVPWHTERIEPASERWSLRLSGTAPAFVSLWYGATLLGFCEPKLDASTDLVVDTNRLSLEPAMSAVVVNLHDAEGRAVSPSKLSLGIAFEQPGADRHRTLSFLPKDADGRYTSLPVEEGRYEIFVTADGFVSRMVPIVVGADGRDVAVEVVLRPATIEVPVVVRGPGGAAVADAALSVLDEETRVIAQARAVKTNLEGRATLPALAAGTCFILVTHERYAPVGRRIAVADPPGEVSLVLSEGEKVVFAPEGSSGPFRIRLEEPDGTPVFDDACNFGRRFGTPIKLGLARGRYRVLLRCPGFKSAEAWFDVGSSTTVRLPLEPH